jgi:TetR/AcrR family transcriptional regulator, regulator of cefoperazone and chloramphenicol sensitivity
MPVAVAKREAAPAGSRGDETRERLLEAALRIFGELGFEGASTRALADAAGANLAAIAYHFGSKEGLYRAVAKFIVERSSETILPTIDRIAQSIASKKLSRSGAIELLHQLLEQFSAIVIGSRYTNSFAEFMMREQLHPGAAFEILYEGMTRPMTEACASLLALASSRRADRTTTLIRAQTLLGQILIFRTSRASVLRQLGWHEFSKEQLKVVQSIVAENVEWILAGK